MKNTFEEIIKADFIPDIAIFCAGSATDDIVEGNFKVGRFKENFTLK